MSAQSAPQDSDRAWRLKAGIVLALVTTAAALFGFVILPLAQPDEAAIGPLTAICRAIGLRPEASRPARGLELQAPPTVSQVTWTTSTLALVASGDPQRGRDVAQQCAPCHGEHGTITDVQAPDVAPAVIPNLAHLGRAASFKQLSDYRSGSRKSELMGTLAQSLSDREAVDVGAYFDSSGNASAARFDRSPPEGQIAALVERGDPGRGIPGCGSCHAPGAGGSLGTPVLAGQRDAYLVQQLKYFRTGERVNDIYSQMREIARKLTDVEIARIASYYAADSAGK
jgi:cytochrome c553